MKKLSDNDFKVAYTLYDAKLFQSLVTGTNLIQSYVKAAPPGQEFARYMQLKSFVEALRESQTDSEPHASS
jgi:hypothetical protein